MLLLLQLITVYLFAFCVCFFCYVVAIKGEVIGSGNAILDVHSFLLISLCQFVELNLSKSEDTREVINALYR